MTAVRVTRKAGAHGFSCSKCKGRITLGVAVAQCAMRHTLTHMHVCGARHSTEGKSREGYRVEHKGVPA